MQKGPVQLQYFKNMKWKFMRNTWQVINDEELEIREIDNLPVKLMSRQFRLSEGMS